MTLRTTTIASLRSRLASALASVIGTKTYRLADGSTTTVDAITIDYGTAPQVGSETWNQIAESHDGLEVVIQPEMQPIYVATLGGYYLQHQTNVLLKQWSPNDNVLSARSLLMLEFGNEIDSVGPRVPRDGTFNKVEFQTFTFNFLANS